MPLWWQFVLLRLRRRSQSGEYLLVWRDRDNRRKGCWSRKHCRSTRRLFRSSHYADLYLPASMEASRDGHRRVSLYVIHAPLVFASHSPLCHIPTRNFSLLSYLSSPSPPYPIHNHNFQHGNLRLYHLLCANPGRVPRTRIRHLSTKHTWPQRLDMLYLRRNLQEYRYGGSEAHPMREVLFPQGVHRHIVEVNARASLHMPE